MYERFEVEAFLTLSEELHFSRTAERLRVTPGRISQTIKKLEHQVGRPLFERTSRQVALTPLGQRLREDLKPGYQQIRSAFETATAIGRGINADLRVGFTAAWSGSLIQLAVDRLQVDHPQFVIGLREITYGAALEALRVGELDRVLMETGFIDVEIGLIIGPTVFSRPQFLAVPATHPLARQDSVSLEDLATIPLITAQGVPEAVAAIYFPKHTRSGLPIVHGPVAPGWQEMLTLIGAGKGATPVCDWAADYYQRPDIAYVPLTEAPPIDQALVWSTARDTVAVRTFARTLTAVADSNDHGE